MSKNWSGRVEKLWMKKSSASESKNESSVNRKKCKEGIEIRRADLKEALRRGGSLGTRNRGREVCSEAMTC